MVYLGHGREFVIHFSEGFCLISFSPNKCYRFLLAVGWHVRGSRGFVPWVRGGIRDAGGQGLSLTSFTFIQIYVLSCCGSLLCIVQVSNH